MKKQDYIKELFSKEQTEIVEVLNYSNIVCFLKVEDYPKLERELKKDHCNHMYNLKHVKKNHLFYIENCDLQYIGEWEYDHDWDDYILCYITFSETGFTLWEREKTVKELMEEFYEKITNRSN